jgi:hypothetical protein
LGEIELSHITALSIKDVTAVELAPIFVHIIIGADINAVFIIDMESGYRWKMLGNVKFVTGPYLCR